LDLPKWSDVRHARSSAKMWYNSTHYSAYRPTTVLNNPTVKAYTTEKIQTLRHAIYTVSE